ncbi:response regulator [Phenylobacterium sp.]|uniref:response regulator n=1 Tax=Phenylobacterium sp. TaxID=1871053 RepID=UPI002CF94557|nr:response regulator [Phenylobacterium sp.]HLZ77387.1 response regulator [Phenylobacterium sp.]
MYTYADLTPDLHLVAIGVVIWVVAVSIAFGVYIPFLRRDGKLLRGFAPRRRRADLPAYVPLALRVVEDLDHAPLPVEPSADAQTFAEPAFPAPVVHRAVDRAVAQSAAATPTPDVTPPREHPETFSVLIVDDNPINRQVLEIVLDSVGIAHASVEDGLKAVEAMQACAYDAVLMDLQMPVMDGFEATRRIRALEAAGGAQPARIIVVSANCADEDIAAGREAGADCHLAKPVSAAAVIGELAVCPAMDRLAA